MQIGTEATRRKRHGWRVAGLALVLLPACASLKETRSESVVSARPFERQVEAAPQDGLRASSDGHFAEAHVERTHICGMQKAEQRIVAIRRERRADRRTVRGEGVSAGGFGVVGLAGGVGLADGNTGPVVVAATTMLIPAVTLGVIALVDAHRGGVDVAYRVDNVPLGFSPRPCGTAPLAAVDVVLACDNGIRLKAITDAQGVVKIPLGPIPAAGLDCTLRVPDSKIPLARLHVPPSVAGQEEREDHQRDEQHQR